MKTTIIFFLISMCVSSIASAQVKVLKAFYSCETKIPEKIKNIENEQIRTLAINKLKEEKQSYVLYSCGGIYGFSAASNAIVGNSFVVEGKRSVYINFKTKEKICQEDILDKSFLIKGPLKALQWNIKEEEKRICGKIAKKATTMIDNKLIVAWYCEDIPSQVGPLGFHGLPGLIMELETERVICTAVDIEILTKELEITPPSKGEIMSRSAFDKLKEKKLKELGIDPNMKKGGIQVIKM